MPKIPKAQLISLSAVPGIGPRRVRSVLLKYPDIEDLLTLKRDDYHQIEGISSELAAAVTNIDLDIGKKAMESVSSMGGKYISYWDEEYPPMLQMIYDAPVGIFVLGDIPTLTCIGIVGTRQPTIYGRKTTEKLTSELITAGFCIVSGFARGIDTISHRKVIDQRGRTIAVLGCGVDVVYPAENKKLREPILEQGAIISEYLPGAKPDAINFPKRNRIISGLSKGVVVVEAGKKSGALITAMNALDQNREVFAVPGPVNSKKSFGTNTLIQQGARLIMNIDDILSEFHLEVQPAQVELLPQLTKEEKKVYASLSSEPVQIDELCNQLKMDTPEVLSILLSLELKNLLEQHPGKLFSRIR
ncbi:MAG: DNA-processing protein DprA [Candidatus Marinimicrobia bacterium]|jgi:DNA processing protein|nr:DNA-processing protein DprA [Candidatus Neomarinimicrobiota bacterium]MDP6853139.1 DNA-processing protein DprA [Candidatus Neomarinimicrobiota bacterium]MDP6936503.1 DNA-processing protein DprA [Candidatus Neomarinimicrobiota bacterium]